jgi:hypothetical protein
MSALEVTFEVELRRADLVRGYARTIARYGSGARLLPIVALLVLLVAADAIYTLAQGRPLEEHHIGFGIAFAVVATIFSLVLVGVSGRVLRALPTTKASYVVDDERGFRVTAGGREERIPFAAFIGAARDRHAVYLYSSRTAFRIIPRRGIPAGDLEALERILVRRLPHPPSAPGGRWVTLAAAAGLVLLFLWARAR